MPGPFQNSDDGYVKRNHFKMCTYMYFSEIISMNRWIIFKYF